jgi:hypothetical protein
MHINFISSDIKLISALRNQKGELSISVGTSNKHIACIVRKRDASGCVAFKIIKQIAFIIL